MSQWKSLVASKINSDDFDKFKEGDFSVLSDSKIVVEIVSAP